MIRWILLLQEFELQIAQRKEEPPKPREKVVDQELKKNVSTIHIPSYTIEHKNNY
jgi:hypothetical protein